MRCVSYVFDAGYAVNNCRKAPAADEGPATMTTEIRKGEIRRKPVSWELSAAPSHAPALMRHGMPSRHSARMRSRG